MVSNAYVVHLTANQNTGLVSSSSLARGFNLTLKALSAGYGVPLQIRGVPLQIRKICFSPKNEVVLVSKLQSYFCV